MRKRPGRTAYQRGILHAGGDGRLRARVTSQQGSCKLCPTSEANCFLVLEHDRGDVGTGEPVSVQPFEGLLQSRRHRAAART